MFMVDSVELRLLEESHQMWELERDGTVGFQCSLESLSEIINVRHMSIDIVTHYQVARRPSCASFSPRPR